MNKLALKIVSIFVVIIYSILVLYWVINDESFYGIRYLSVWSIVVMGLLIWLFIVLDKKIKNKEDADFKEYNKFYHIFIGLIMLPMVIGLPDKLSILFYDVNADISKMKEFVVEVNGYRKTGTSRQGGKFWAVVKTENSGYRIICNLIVLADCEYGKYKGEVFKAKAVIGERYPIANDMIIYEMVRSDGSKLVDYNDQVKLYERNRSYISYFLFLIYLPSMFFALVVPRAFK